MSSYTQLSCFAVDWHQFAQLLGQVDTAALAQAIRASGKQTPRATKKLEKELELHLPWLERIIKGVPAVDPSPFGDDDDDGDDSELDFEASIQMVSDSDEEDWDDDDEEDDEPSESESYLDAFEWLCAKLGRSMPVSESLYVWSIVQYDYYGFTEALRRFQSPFPLPKLDDNGLHVGFIPNCELAEFQLKPIDAARDQELQSAIKEMQSIVHDSNDESNSENDDESAGDDEDDRDEGVASFLAKRALRDFQAPDQAEIDLAHDELVAIFADIHQMGKDFVGIIRVVT